MTVGIQVMYVKAGPKAKINPLQWFMGQISGLIIESVNNDFKKHTVPDKDITVYEKHTSQICYYVWIWHQSFIKYFFNW